VQVLAASEADLDSQETLQGGPNLGDLLIGVGFVLDGLADAIVEVVLDEDGGYLLGGATREVIWVRMSMQ
jgi:hypothetical protein